MADKVPNGELVPIGEGNGQNEPENFKNAKLKEELAKHNRLTGVGENE